MTETLYNFEDVEKKTNLKPDFIRRCIRFFKDELSPHTIKTDNNTLSFNSNALEIFDKISQYKTQKFTLPSIKEKLQLPTKEESKTYTNSNITLPNDTKDNFIEPLFNEIKAYRNDLVTTHQELTNAYKTLIEKEKVIEVQKYQLKLLTDGRSPEEVKTDFINKEVELRVLISKSQDLQEKVQANTNMLEANKKIIEVKNKEVSEQKNIIFNLEKEINNFKLLNNQQEILLQEKEKKILELEKYNKEKDSKIKEIIKQLESLEGKFFIGSKRKDLFKNLEIL